MDLVYCVDFGSTFTKAALVDVHSGELVATASHPTTIDTDVLDGWDAVRADLEAEHGAGHRPVLACSSAGGGLRIAVVGNEELVTSEAGRRVALSSGGRVVHVSWGAVDLEALRAAASDVVLLVGGTDGGNAEVLLGNARALARARWRTPVVVAGNVEAAAEVEALLLTHPDVQQAAVMAVKDELREEEVLACVVPMPGALADRALADTLVDWCLGRLAYFKAPGWILFLETLPTTGTQKVQKREIFPRGVDPRQRSDVIDVRAHKRRR
jgi:hypothetical protein